MIKKSISSVIVFCLVFQGNLAAQVLPDGTTATFIDYSQHNNTPVVNIASPSGKGVSHNKFSEYNVDNRNIILNNTKQDGLESKLGGYVVGNPNLIKADKEAKIILNEVTSNKKTMIAGYTEVLGQKAELVIANPNGISIAGGGFLNTANLSLVTGSSNMLDGGIASFNISQRGVINVLGKKTQDKDNLGIDGSSLSQLFLAGRYINIAGDIYAPQINILTGNYLFNYLDKTLNSVEMNTTAQEFALDASALGSMYGGRINIIGTEKGFGVKSQGELVADLDDIIITNSGDIEYKRATANNDIKITSAGTLKAAESFAKGNISFTAKEAEYETIRATNDITINADKVTHKHNAEAGGNITIAAKEFNILKDLYPASQNNVLLAYGNIILNADAINNYGEVASYGDININSKLLNNNALILANKNLNITNGNVFNNENAVLFASDAISIKTDGYLYNTKGDILGAKGVLLSGLNKARMSLLENMAGNIESRDGSINISADKINNISINNCDPSKEVCYTKEWFDTYNRPDTGQTVLYLQERAQSVMSASGRGSILAANDININTQDIYNISSIISAGNAVNITADNLYNIRPEFEVSLLNYFWKRYKHRHRVGKVGYKNSIRNDYWYAGYTSVLQSLTPAVISAQTVNINATNKVFNDAYTEEHTSLPWSSSPTNQKLADAASSGIIDPIKLTDFGLGGMFKEAGPNSQYLFVTNNRFLNIYDFVGSDYFNKKMGFMSDFHGAKWLGDPVYEQKILEKAILEVTGNHYLYEGMVSMNDQMTRLYDNAFEAINNGLGLEFGKALTPQQIAALTDNIVWYVEQEVNGQMVMVPTLYVAAANTDKFLTDNASSIKGNNILVKSNDINNSGNIYGQDVALIAKNDIVNTSGIISGGQSVNLEAGNDIRIETKLNVVDQREVFSRNEVNRAGVAGLGSLTTHQSITYGEIPQEQDYLGTGYTSSWLGGTAGIYAGNNITMQAGSDIILKAAEVISGGDTELSAKGNVNIGTHTLDNSVWSNQNGNKSESTVITNVGSYVQTGGNFNVSAGKDATIKGSDIISYGDVSLAGENVNILSALDSSHMYTKMESKDAFSSRLEEHLKDTQTHRGSNIYALGDININAKNDATILASNLGGIEAVSGDGKAAGTEGGSININAGNNINILAGQNYEATMDNVEKSSFFGLKGRKDKVYDEVKTLEAASVFAGKDLNLTSGKNTLIFASDVGAQGDGNIETGGDFSLLSGINEHILIESHEKKSLGGVALNYNRGRASAGLSYDYKSQDIEQTTQTTKSSSLNIGEDLTIKSAKNIIIKGSDISADSAVLEAENIMMLAQEEFNKYTEKTKEGKIIVSVGVGNAYVDAIYALEDLGKAIGAVSDATKQLNKIKNLYSEGKASELALSEATANLAAATLSLGAAMTATVAAGTKAAAAADTLGTGLYAEVATEAKLKETNLTSTTTNNRGSVINTNKDISFNTVYDMTQQGSAVISDSGDINYNIGGNLNIEATANRGTTEVKVEEGSITLTAGSAGGMTSANTSKSKSKESFITYNNSITSADSGSINYKVGGNMDAKGYNALAEDININVSGSLNLESLQDSYYASSRGSGFGAGLGGGGISGGYNGNSGYTDKAWVNSQSGIIGTNSVNIAADSMHLKGSVIANAQEGQDKGNLNIAVNSFTYEDIKNFNNTENKGGGLNIGPSSDVISGLPGQTHIIMQHQGHETELLTKATVGQGIITVGGASANTAVNRDINDMEKLIKDKTTGTLDLDLAIDNRWFNSETRDQVNPIKLYENAQEEVYGYFLNAKKNGEDIDLSLTPPFGGKSYMGEETINPSTGEVSSSFKDYSSKTPEDLTFWEKIDVTSPKVLFFDTNPIFSAFYRYIPGMKAATLHHDAQMKDKEQPELFLTIPSSFANTYYYLIFGKPFSKLTGAK